MPKTIQSILIFVCIGCFVPFSTAQDAFDKTVEKIKALETKLENNRKRVDEKTAEFRKNHKNNRPKDQFDSDESYEKLMAELDVAVSNYRLDLLKESVEKDQIELARLHREHIPSNDVTVTLDTYDANSEFFPIIIKTPTERFTDRLDIKRDDARILHDNWDKIQKAGYLTVGPAPAYQRILAKVTLEYPDLWRQPVTWHFNNAGTMVLIPAGDFEMGSNDSEVWDSEKPVHTVYLNAFYIDKYEVTVGQYKQFVQATGHPAPDWDEVSQFSPTDQHPIIFVSWYDAMAYAQWAGKRLPTQAEWEKAARGGLVGAKYPWGDAAPNGTQCNFADKSSNLSWADMNADDGYQFTAPVGSFPGNRYDLFDMAGNVMEWCLDANPTDFDSSSARRNPIEGVNSVIAVINSFSNNNLTNRTFSAIRDSSWFRGDVTVLRVGIRLGSDSTLTSDEHGFRCVKDVPR